MIALLLFIFGLVIGSFLNVLIDRSPTDESILWGRSHCDFCHKTLAWYELVPLLSFVVQRGRCAHCHKRLSMQYPLLEFGTGLAFVWLFSLVPPDPNGAMYIFALIRLMIIGSAYIVILVADMKYQLIPDAAVIGLVIAGCITLFLSPAQWLVHLATAAGGGGIFLFLWWVTRKKGMGFGDVKLAAALGFLMGYPLGVVTYYIAFLTGAFCGVILILAGKARMKTKIAFGPFLIIGAMVAMGWGTYIVHIWLQYI